MNRADISRLPSGELWTRLLELAKLERGATCDLVEALAETDRRGLYKDHAYVSLFECCVHKLGFSEAAAYRRIRAARALKLFPPIGPMFRQGRLTLETIVLLHPYLEDSDAAALVCAAAGKRVWEVERLIAGRRTEEPRRDVVRFVAAIPPAGKPPADAPLFVIPPASAPKPPEPPDKQTIARPQAVPASHAASPSEAVVPAVILEPAVHIASTATSGPREAARSNHAVRIAFTADEGFFGLLKLAQAAMRHKYPSGRLDGVFRDALEALLRGKTPWAYREPLRRGRR